MLVHAPYIRLGMIKTFIYDVSASLMGVIDYEYQVHMIIIEKIIAFSYTGTMYPLHFILDVRV